MWQRESRLNVGNHLPAVVSCYYKNKCLSSGMFPNGVIAVLLQTPYHQRKLIQTWCLLSDLILFGIRKLDYIYTVL